MNDPLVWAEIDLAAYSRNLQALQGIARAGARLMAVVKADGYGHGAIEVSRVALRSGADSLGVARLHEAVELREADIQAPILIFGASPIEQTDLLLEHDLTQTVFSLPMAATLAERAARQGQRVRVHIKVDTGMGRLGILATDDPAARVEAASSDRILKQVEAIARLAGLEVEGLFTHYATADSTDRSYAAGQLERFLALSDRLRAHGLEFPILHAANSAALLRMPESHLDLVRPGIATYGLLPSEAVRSDSLHLEPVLTWKTRIIQLKKVPQGFGISYGVTYKTTRPTTIATVAVGYADGLSRRLSSRGQMLVGGRRVPMVGRVCMDLAILDVGEVADVEVGDEVVIIGRQGDQELTADDMAEALDTINYEIVTSIASRVPRIYRR